RSTLVSAINGLGFDVIPYSFYYSKGLRYKIIERSSRYGEYIRYGRSYNSSGVPVSSYIPSFYSGIYTFY
ncbi:hypothetical protein C8A00DRAFT_19460, partial [Chaetomidium leptoderma]